MLWVHNCLNAEGAIGLH